MKISKKELTEMGACVGGLKRFIKQTDNTDDEVSVIDLIGGENTTNDLLWLAGRKLPKEKIVKFSVNCAKLVLHLYENKYSDDRPRKAIEAVDQWLQEPTEENLLKCRIAADAADYAAYDAAAAAAYATTTTTTTTTAAAAAYAADAADYADAAAAGLKEQLLNLLVELFTL